MTLDPDIIDNPYARHIVDDIFDAAMHTLTKLPREDVTPLCMAIAAGRLIGLPNPADPTELDYRKIHHRYRDYLRGCSDFTQRISKMNQIVDEIIKSTSGRKACESWVTYAQCMGVNIPIEPDLKVLRVAYSKTLLAMSTHPYLTYYTIRHIQRVLNGSGERIPYRDIDGFCYTQLIVRKGMLQPPKWGIPSKT